MTPSSKVRLRKIDYPDCQTPGEKESPGGTPRRGETKNQSIKKNSPPSAAIILRAGLAELYQIKKERGEKKNYEGGWEKIFNIRQTEKTITESKDSMEINQQKKLPGKVRCVKEKTQGAWVSQPLGVTNTETPAGKSELRNREPGRGRIRGGFRQPDANQVHECEAGRRASTSEENFSI